MQGLLPPCRLPFAKHLYHEPIHLVQAEVPSQAFCLSQRHIVSFDSLLGTATEIQSIRAVHSIQPASIENAQKEILDSPRARRALVWVTVLAKGGRTSRVRHTANWEPQGASEAGNLDITVEGRYGREEACMDFGKDGSTSNRSLGGKDFVNSRQTPNPSIPSFRRQPIKNSSNSFQTLATPTRLDPGRTGYLMRG